jgi:hypothetical protein
MHSMTPDAGHARSRAMDIEDARTSMDDVADAGDTLETAVRRDCAETLACDAMGDMDRCIATTLDVLKAAAPETLMDFFRVFASCAAFHGCDYVRCTVSS